MISKPMFRKISFISSKTVYMGCLWPWTRMKAQLETIRQSALEAITAVQAGPDLEALRVKYLGKKGELTAVLKQMGKLSPEERPAMGQMANDVRAALEAAIEGQSAALSQKVLLQVEGVCPVPGGMVFRGVEFGEVVIRLFNLRAVHDLKAHVQEPFAKAPWRP